MQIKFILLIFTEHNLVRYAATWADFATVLSSSFAYTRKDRGATLTDEDTLHGGEQRPLSVPIGIILPYGLWVYKFLHGSFKTMTLLYEGVICFGKYKFERENR